MIGDILLTDELLEDFPEFDIIPSTQDFQLNIYVDDKKIIDKQLKNHKSFKKSMDYLRKLNLDNYIDMIEYIENNFDNILDSIEYIILDSDAMGLEFIKSNPILLTKKIVLHDPIYITDYDKVVNLINEYKDIIDNIYVSLYGNKNYISLIDALNTIKKVKDQAEEYKRLNLSPIETLMYIYDKVRSRLYTLEEDYEDETVSRDLSEVLFGDKIVCLGYANIFAAYLTYVGFKNDIVSLRRINNPNIGHTRNMAYIKDDKYDIDGVYYFDLTWDSIDDQKTDRYLYSYEFFARTRKYMDSESVDYEDTRFPIYMNECEDDTLYAKSISYMMRFINGKPANYPQILFKIRDNDKEYIEGLKPLFDKFNRPISANTMLKIINNVRKVEYYQDPELYQYFLLSLYNIIINSGWTNDAKTLIKDDNLSKDINQVRLTKVLSNFCKKR